MRHVGIAKQVFEGINDGVLYIESRIHHVILIEHIASIFRRRCSIEYFTSDTGSLCKHFAVTVAEDYVRHIHRYHRLKDPYCLQPPIRDVTRRMGTEIRSVKRCTVHVC